MTMVPDRSPMDLRGIVEDVAADPSRWLALVHHDAEQRHFSLLHRDDDLELYVVCWSPGHDTGFHDHDVSAAAIAVVDGAVREQRLGIGRANVERRFAAGQTFTVRPSDIHRVQHAGSAPSVTIHAYSPPLGRMGQYEVAPNGTLQRHPQDATEELRPVEA